MIRWAWLIPLRGMSWIPTLLMGTNSIGPSTGLAMTLTTAMTMTLIAMALVAMNLTLDHSILGIWVTPALFYEMARFATAVASGS